ncbi:Hydroxyacid oxidase 1 [Coemansia sp. Benny D115]|nr:Hydroxyacid oxidase 1 [Coemansia sp. Benny D115]
MSTPKQKTGFVSLDDFEQYAMANLDRNALDYYRSGAQDMITLRDNQRAFDRIAVRPRVLRDVSKLTTKTTLLGHPIDSPICIAPTAMQRMAHPDGEVATARAAQRMNTAMCLSSWSTTSIEDVADQAPGSAPRWMQLYVYKDREATQKLVERAMASGYEAIALTVDTPYLGRRLADIRNRFQLPPHLTMANFTDQGKAQVSKVEKSATATNASGLAAYVASQIDPTLSWEHVAWVKKISKIPVLVKGILTAEDAKIAVEDAKVDGIIVSNHGGRQMDTAPATIDVLEEVCQAVAGRVPVYLDGGVRRGTDVFKALALGAKAVFLGRPALWALNYNGEEGVVEMLEMINEEFRLAMALAGCVSVEDINRDHVRVLGQQQPRL